MGDRTRVELLRKERGSNPTWICRVGDTGMWTLLETPPSADGYGDPVVLYTSSAEGIPYKQKLADGRVVQRTAPPTSGWKRQASMPDSNPWYGTPAQTSESDLSFEYWPSG